MLVYVEPFVNHCAWELVHRGIEMWRGKRAATATLQTEWEGRQTEPVPRAREMVRQAKAYATEA